MVELFAIGAFWFWVLLIAEITLLLIFSEYDNGIGATISLVVFLGFLQWVGSVDLVLAVKHNWLALLGALGGYVAFGVTYMTFRWIGFVNKEVGKLDAFFATWLENHKLPADTKAEDLAPDLKLSLEKDLDHTKNWTTGQTVDESPKVKYYKAMVMRWLMMWPFSLTLYICKDMVREFFMMVYNRFAGFLQRLSDRAFAKKKIRPNSTTSH